MTLEELKTRCEAQGFSYAYGEFKDYTEDELVKIFEGMVKKSGFKVTDDAILKLREVINEYKDSKNFGNARFVRNVFEKSIVKHASNTKDKKRKE